MSVHELDAEDFGLREGGRDVDGERWRLKLVIVGKGIDYFLDLFDLVAAVRLLISIA